MPDLHQTAGSTKKGAKKLSGITPPVILGYVPSWSVWRPGVYKYGVEDVRGDLITHLIYAFINVEPDGTLVHPDKTGGDYVKMQELKSKYPDLKVVPSVGGATYTYNIQQMVANEASIKAFARNCKTFINTYGFDGIDIDWEYPTAAERDKYTQLLQLTRSELGPDLLLMSAVPAGKQNFVGFDPQAMNTYLDVVSVMTYDFHGAGWETVTGHNAPLVGPGDFTMTAAMKLWIEHGVREDIMVVGLPFYGRTWTLANPANHGPGAASTGPGAPGPLGTSEYLGWVEFENMSGWNEEWDTTAQVPYAWKDNQWLSFDNPQSLGLKIDYAAKNNHSGVMIWDLAFDSQATLLPVVYNQVMAAFGVKGASPTKPNAKGLLHGTTSKIISPGSKKPTTSPSIAGGSHATKASP